MAKRPTTLDIQPAALPDSGEIRLSQVKSEFSKGDNMLDYLGAASGVPSSPPLKLTDFYGKSSGGGGTPPSNFAGLYDGPITDQFSNSGVSWKLRNTSIGTVSPSKGGNVYIAMYNGKYPCWWAKSRSEADALIAKFKSYTYFGLVRKNVGRNSQAGWTKFTKGADGSSDEWLVYPSNFSGNDSSVVLEWFDAVDAGKGADCSWYEGSLRDLLGKRKDG
jgi:hypothetical protein